MAVYFVDCYYIENVAVGANIKSDFIRSDSERFCEYNVLGETRPRTLVNKIIRKDSSPKQIGAVQLENVT